MELLRKQLGMRPTDVRRVIRKAPDVLAPRADGSTAAETVNVSSARCFCVRCPLAHLRRPAPPRGRTVSSSTVECVYFRASRGSQGHMPRWEVSPC